jgi:hypothetical protein
MKILDGSTRALSVSSSDTVLRVKQKLQTLTGVAADRARLIYRGRELTDDTHMLRDCGVESESPMFLLSLLAC